MIKTSDVWKRLAAIVEHTEEYAVDIAGERYEDQDIETIGIKMPLFDEFSIGNTCSAELTLSVYPRVQPPKMAKIIVYVRLEHRGEVSEWLQRGVYYIDQRQLDPWGRLNITAYDSMLKAEQNYIPDQDYGDWPKDQKAVTQEIAEKMGIEIDPRTQLADGYLVQYLPDATCREILGYIGGSNVGNWVITNEDKLLLVKIGDLPPETNYLVNESGNPLLFGEVRILV